MNKIAKLIINFVLIAIVIVALIVGNTILFRFEQEVNTALSPPIVDTEALEQSTETGQAMARRIMEEGAVLLQNKDNTLPLDYATDKQVNVFGWRSIDWIYGSEGQNASGGVAPENDNFDENVDIYKALNKYGISYNERLFNMYYKFKTPDHQSANLKGTHISTLTPLREPKIEDKEYYSDELLEYTKNYSDTAIVVIGRMAGEGMNASTTKQEKTGPGASNDNTRHYLELSSEEEAMLTYCGANFEKVIVLLNVSNPFECGFLETIPGVDACMYIGFTGTRAVQALPAVLYGEKSPSGHTVDTFAYDLFSNPANVWKGGSSYTDYSRTYVDYVEGIYVGYKWYETADTMGVWANETRTVPAAEGTITKNGYDAVVQYPFGYGASYNTYSWSVGEISVAPGSDITDETKISIPVTVRNDGEYPGRDVVQAYVTVPYKDHGIEKASVSLVAFNKTIELAPNAEETITIEIDANDFASYDCYDKTGNGTGNGFKGYELEDGTYTVSLRTDSHHVKTVNYGGGVVTASFDYNVAKTINIEKDKITGAKVGNLFTGDDAVDTTPLDANQGDFVADIPWFSRMGFLKPSEFSVNRRAATPSAKRSGYSAERALAWDNATVDEFGNEIDQTPVVWGVDSGLRVAENGIINDLGRKLGADYNASEWQTLINQITISEAVEVVNNYYGSDAIASVGKPKLTDLDGPAQMKGFSSAPRGTGYPTMVVVAATWNPKLAYEFGKAYGDDMKSLSVMGLWGWAIDCHRTAWFGRNHESPSEDGTLSGTIIANAVKGLGTRGRYCFLKHFALYGYGGDSIWLSEQTFREIYLKPYRKAFVEGGALGAMTTYQGIGAEHSETTVALLTGVLRNEWAFKGAITTDYIAFENSAYCDSILRSGGNLGMGVGLGTLSGGGVTYTTSSPVRIQRRLQQAMKEVIYMWLRADYNEQQYLLAPDTGDTYVMSTSINSWEWWKPMVYSLDVCVGVLAAMWAALVLISVFMKKKNAPAAIKDKEASDENIV